MYEFHRNAFRKRAGRPAKGDQPLGLAVRQQVGDFLDQLFLQLFHVGSVADLLPTDRSYPFGLTQALEYLHAPPPDASLELLREGLHPAQLRLALEELVAHNLSLQSLRAKEQLASAPSLPLNSSRLQAFLATLPFTPTTAQA